MEVPGVSLIAGVKVDHRADAGSEIAGHILHESVQITDVAPNDSGTKSVSFDFDVDVINGDLYGAINAVSGELALEYGDAVEVWATAVVGVLGTDAISGSTDVTVPSTVMSNVDVGDYIEIDGDGKNHWVIAKDADNDVITLKDPLDVTHSAGSVVRLQRYFVGRPSNPLKLVPGRSYGWGAATFSGARLPKGNTINMRFHNSSGSITKHVLGAIVILY